MKKNLLINTARLFLLLVLFLDFYNGFLTLHPRIPKLSSWGTLWQGLFLTVLITWITIEIVNHYLIKKGDSGLPSYFWSLTVLGTGGDSLANFFLLFELPYFDKFMHFSAAVIFSFLAMKFLNMLENLLNLRFSKLLAYYLVLSIINLGAVVYEIGEWIGDKYFDANNIIGVFDTTEDIIFNLIGASVVILIDFTVHKIKRQ